jgi:heat shock protein HslJ
LKDLGATASHVFSGDQLVLNMRIDTGNMIFSALPTPELTGSEWELRAYNNGRGGVVSVLPGIVSTATFAADGQLHGSAGCNSFHGSYTVNGDALSIGPLATTRMMCEQQVMQQEQAYLAALQASTRYDFDAGRLQLFNATGARQADFAPAGTPTN